MGAEKSVKKLNRTKIGKKKREVKSETVNERVEEAQVTKEGKKRSEKLRNKKRKNVAIVTAGNGVPQIDEVEDRLPRKRAEQGDDKLRRKKRKGIKIVEKGNDELNADVKAAEVQSDQEIVIPPSSENFASDEGLNGADTRKTRSGKGKSKKAAKTKKKSQLPAGNVSQDKLLEKRQVVEHEVYEMSSGDEDYSKGMKKWITQYHQSRPGPNVLQERIDDFIMAHEAKEEQARKEKEAQAAEGGWTVVVQQKGRKKTTDADSGIAVGSVAQAAVLDNMTKKKNKEVGIDFYQFQKRDARKSEIMMLQSKFEQDKKRIQEMRAARKFRPY